MKREKGLPKYRCAGILNHCRRIARARADNTNNLPGGDVLAEIRE